MEYKQVDLKGAPIQPCPICGSAAKLWRYSEDLDSHLQHVVMCEHDGVIGERGGLIHDGCLLVMPPQDFYRPRKIEAIVYWNSYALGLQALRKENNKPVAKYKLNASGHLDHPHWLTHKENFEGIKNPEQYGLLYK